MAKKTKPSGGKSAARFALELKGISKSFGPVKANQNIDLAIEAGTIHGIIGENGAGKSTLMNILYGLHKADEGEIHVNGELQNIKTPSDAIDAGIGMVHQHFMLVPRFTVLENVMLGSEGGALLSLGQSETIALLDRLGKDYDMVVDPHAFVSDLNVGARQRVEILKALKGGANILILDEPTGVLTPQESEKLFEILNILKSDGVTVLLITHKLEEIMNITDHVTVMRHGEVVGHVETSQTNPSELASMMVGRDVLLNVEKTVAKIGEAVLSVRDICLTSKVSGHTLLQDISFDVHEGEIFGIAGVAGNGQSELLEILSGMDHPDSGSIVIDGLSAENLTKMTADEARKYGIGHIPEDRHLHGLILDFQARENMILGYHSSGQSGDGYLLNYDYLTDFCSQQMAKFDTRPANPLLNAGNFSGGNQQKIVIARELEKHPRILLVGQPTRGVDVGAIEFIHKQLIALRDAGCAIVLVSVELEEIMGLSDRICVMNNGQQVATVDASSTTRDELGMMMAGINPREAA